MVFEYDEFVLSKSGLLVGKSYVSNRMFKLNVVAVNPKKNNGNNSSAYLLESSNLWHGRLGHINYDTLHRLINLNHVPAFQINSKHIVKLVLWKN